MQYRSSVGNERNPKLSPPRKPSTCAGCCVASTHQGAPTVRQWTKSTRLHTCIQKSTQGCTLVYTVEFRHSSLTAARQSAAEMEKKDMAYERPPVYCCPTARSLLHNHSIKRRITLMKRPQTRSVEQPLHVAKIRPPPRPPPRNTQNINRRGGSIFLGGKLEHLNHVHPLAVLITDSFLQLGAGCSCGCSIRETTAMQLLQVDRKCTRGRDHSPSIVLH